MERLQLIEDIRAQGQYLFRAGLLTVLVLAVYVLHPEGSTAPGKRLRAVFRRPAQLVFLYYAMLILMMTVLGRRFTWPTNNVLDRFWIVYRGQLNYDLIENVLFFIPYTFFFLAGFRPARPLRAALTLSLGTTAAIELCQLVGGLGEFQLADMLYNTLGGLIGWALWTGAERLWRRFRPRRTLK